MLADIRATRLFFDIDGMQWVPEGGRMRQRPVLFLLHGGPGGDHVQFKTQLGSLTDTAQLVFIDHRGSGRSQPCDPASCTLENNVEDIEALRLYLGLERIALLGSSYGGMVAQGYATRYPENLSSLILSVTAASYEFLADARQNVAERGTPEQQQVCQWLFDGSFESQDQLRQYYRAMMPWYSTTFDESTFDETWSRSIRNYEQLNLGFGGFLREMDYRDQLAAITCPTLVLAGRHDWICPVRHSEEIAARIPRAHLKIFEDSSHAIPADQPEDYLAVLRGFLTCQSL